MGHRPEGQRPRHPLPTLHPGAGRQEPDRCDDRKGTRRDVSEAGKESRLTMGVLDGKVALVTGSSRGIGAAIARLFAQEGARVAVHGRDVAALSAVRADIERAGGRAIQVVADVTQFAEIEAMRRHIEAELGPIDILVTNAGGSFTKPGPLEETSVEGWHASVDGN